MSEAEDKVVSAYVPDFVFEEIEVDTSDNEKSTDKPQINVTGQNDTEDGKEEVEEEEFAFNLFSSASVTNENDKDSKKDSTTKSSEKPNVSVVVLTKDEENPVDDLLKASAAASLKSIDPHGYLVDTPEANLFRPESYYFSQKLITKLNTDNNENQLPTTKDTENKIASEISISAVSFADVLKLGTLTKECKSIRTDYGGGKAMKDKIIDYTALGEKARLARMKEKKTKRLGKKSRDRAKKRVEAAKLQRKEERERKKMRKKQFGNRGGFNKSN